MAEERKNYEIGFLVSSEDDAEQIADVLTGKGAEIASRAPVSRIPLAYPIHKQDSAHFGSIIFSAEGHSLSEVEKTLRMNKNVLRHMIITSHPVRESRITVRPAIQGDKIARGKERTLRSDGLARTKEVKKRTTETRELTNEALEKKLEEILQ